MLRTIGMVGLAVAALLPSPLTAQTEAHPSAIDLSDDRYVLAIGVVEDAEFTGRVVNEIISQYEFVLRLRLRSSEATAALGLSEVQMPYWVHTEGGEERLIGKEVLLVLDRENAGAVVRREFAQRVFCMDEDVLENENWYEVTGVYELGPNCIEYTGDW